MSRRGGSTHDAEVATLRRYLKEIGRYPPLNHDQEIELARLRVRVIAVYPGPAEGVAGFRAAFEATFGEEEELPYEIYYDVDSRLPRELDLLDDHPESKVLAKPSTIVIDREGRIRYAYVGEHRADRPAAETVLDEVRDLLR